MSNQPVYISVGTREEKDDLIDELDIMRNGQRRGQGSRKAPIISKFSVGIEDQNAQKSKPKIKTFKLRRR